MGISKISKGKIGCKDMKELLIYYAEKYTENYDHINLELSDRIGKIDQIVIVENGIILATYRKISK